MAGEAPPISWGGVDENSLTPHDVDGIRYETYPSITEKILELTFQIERWYRERQSTFTRIAGAPKGAYPLMSILPERFGVRNDELTHVPVQSYKGTQRGQLVIARHMPTREEIEGERYLLAEEVWDTGTTPDFVRRYLLAQLAAEVIVSCLYFKDDNNRIPGGAPHIYIEAFNGWIDFPWERERRRVEEITGASEHNHEALIVDPTEYISWIAAQNGLTPEQVEDLSVY